MSEYITIDLLVQMNSQRCLVYQTSLSKKGDIMSELHSELTELAPSNVVPMSSENACKTLNDLLIRTFFSLWVDIAGKRYRILRFIPLAGHNFAVDTTGMRNVCLPWDCILLFKMGDSFLDFQ